MTDRRHEAAVLVGALAGVAACDGLPCRTNVGCPIGMFCDAAAGRCDYECLSSADCAAPTRPGRRAICTNQGRCAEAGSPPRLLVEAPTQGETFPFETRALTVAGRVIAETASVEISVSTRNTSGCAAEGLVRLRVENPTPGTSAELPFTLDDVSIDPGLTTVIVEARADLALQTYVIDVERSCAGCPEVVIEEPVSASLERPLVPRLSGRISPPPPAGSRWRVTDDRGQVLDGSLPVVVEGDVATFRLLDVPTFGGRSRVEVIAPASGGTEGSCSTTVLAPPAPERSLLVMSTWDNGSSDLDLVLVGPGASLANESGDIASPTRRASGLPVRVLDDFDGLGPETLRADPLPDGTYGLVVEPVTDGGQSGSSVVIRLAWEDRLLTPRPLGPRFVSAARDERWVVGAVRVEGGTGRFIEVDEVVGSDSLPSRPPGDWPTLR